MISETGPSSRQTQGLLYPCSHLLSDWFKAFWRFMQKWLNQFIFNDCFKVSFTTFQTRNLIINFLSILHKIASCYEAQKTKVIMTDRGSSGDPDERSDMITYNLKTSQAYLEAAAGEELLGIATMTSWSNYHLNTAWQFTLEAQKAFTMPEVFVSFQARELPLLHNQNFE